ncbi:nitroreductase family protein [Limosilactobacillus sp.]|jgi:nitroreductase|uniref:nitroreductase family protein n=1 Tax=Limosilactobacillus sp. TaxID=2773925 RepID=UPI0025BB1912|nr:nitroreductase family protein [Limosilactobacillus sp.]MCH3922933.1 nitroreductase family protein [Limosilactobacillus sp.]MCH3927616.1 nitroreductase family protein [Limosilactobacillus sp.]
MVNAITKRQSVRKFLTAGLSTETVQKLVDAFQSAPCGMHQADVMQAVVVTDAQLCQQVEDATRDACYGAPLLFVILTKKGSPFGERDASVGAENVMIQATELGLGSVYVMGGAIKLNNYPGVLQSLGVPAGFEVTTIVPVGKVAEQPAPEPRTDRYRVQIK